MAVIALAVIAIAALSAVVALGTASHPGGSQSGAALQRQELLTSGQAASWVAQQVGHDAVVSCDQAMCAALRADGFASRKLVVLGLTSLPPLRSDVVVVTAAVRGMFGSSLAAAYAPVVLASFGTGPAEVSVRVMAPHGVVPYQAALNSDLASRKAFGSAALLNNNRITLSGITGKQIAAGAIDSRLVLSLADLASYQPIQIMDFGDPGPGASADVPLRYVDLAVSDPAASLGGSSYPAALHVYLSKQNTQFRPASSQIVGEKGNAVFRIEVTAPSPLGLLKNH